MTRSSPRIALIACALFLLSACGGLPGNAKREARDITKTVEAVEAEIVAAEKAFAGYRTQDPEIAGYLAREKASTAFSQARAEKARAAGIYQKEIKPILDRNDREEQPKLVAATKRANTAIRQSRAIAAKPGQRFKRLTEAKRQSGPWPEQAKRLSAAAKTDHEASTALVARYQKSYPTRRDAIATRYGQGESLIASVNLGAATVAAQAANKAAAKPIDYAAFADGHTAVVDGSAKIGKLRQQLTRDLPSLDRSYSKILSDMKAEYTVCASRTSWYENTYDDFPRETGYDYPCVLVSEDVFETAEEFDDRDQDFATYGSIWGGGEVRINSIGDVTDAEAQALWKALNLDPKANWPGGSDNSATFWIRAAEAHYFHKYTYVSNGVRALGGWEEVTPELYEEHWDDLGLALLEKPYGKFEDEVSTAAAPPGMALIGDTKTGEWRTDNNGNSFWFWYPLFMSTYGRDYGPGWGGYSRAEWDEYNRSQRNRDAYYGGSGGRSYGTHGSTTQTGPLRGSDFAKRGGFKEAAAEVRGAGQSNRSGGPQSGK